MYTNEWSNEKRCEQDVQILCSSCCVNKNAHTHTHTHLSSSLLSYTINRGKSSKALTEWRRENAEAAAITLPIWSVWNVAMLYCMWTDTFVMSDTTRGRREGLANSSLIPTWEQDWRIVYTMTRLVHDSYCACKVWFIRAWRWRIIMHMSTLGVTKVLILKKEGGWDK